MLQYFAIPNADTTTRKGIIDGVIYRILAESGINKDELVYEDVLEGTMQPGSTIGEAREIKFATNDHVVVTLNEERSEINRISRGTGLDIECCFFNNTIDEVTAAPVRTWYKATLTLKKNNKSKGELQRWLNIWDSKLDMGALSFVTESESYYYLPGKLLELLEACYTAAEKRVPRHDTFEDYLKANMARYVTLTTNQTGGQSTYTVKHAPTRIEVVYDIGSPTAEKDESKGWSAEINISWEYQAPDEIVVSYPFIINQTVLPALWCPPTESPFMSNETLVERSGIQTGMDAITTPGLWPEQHLKLPFLLTPSESFVKIRSPWRHVEVPVFGVDMLFEEDNMTDPFIVDTTTLPYYWNEHIKAYIDDCRKLKPDGSGCVFQFNLFVDNAIINKNNYRWVENKMWLTGEINVRSHYYLMENFRLDWRRFDERDILIFSRHPKALEWIVNWILPRWEYPEDYFDRPKLPIGDTFDVVNKIDDLTKTKDQSYRPWLTIFNSKIITVTV